MTKKLLIFLLFPVLCYSQKNTTTQSATAAIIDTTGQKPDLSKMKYEDIKWAKSEGLSFWFYYKPTQYMFKSNEFETILLENGDILAYIHELQRYVLLPGYLNAEKNKEYGVEPVANSNCVFIRSDVRGYWIYDKGFRVSNIQVLGMNATRQYLLKSGFTDKRYMVDEVDFKFAKLNTPIGILAE